MIRMATRPRWVLLFLLVMGLAAGFAWLGQWQLERAIEAAQPIDAETETIIPLVQLQEPGVPSSQTAGGHMTEVNGVFDPAGYTLLTGRLNQGQQGFWVVGRLVVSENAASLPIALGWTDSVEVAEATKEELSALGASDPVLLTGRFMPTEAPDLPDRGADPLSESTLSVASLINQWPDFTGEVYSGYLVADNTPSALEPIDSIAPMNEGSINWLNIFYAVEWIVFAGFAFYIWWRLVKDAVEREEDELAQAAAEVN